MKKIFSYRLWIEGLRRLRIAGFVTLGFVVANSVLVPLIYFVGGTITPADFGDIPFPGIISDPVILPAVMVAAPIMTLILFSFLNRRRSSDFFHALPYTRLCTIISFFASLLTWLFGIVIVSALLSAGSHAILGNGSLVPPIFKMLPGILILTFQICAGVTLGMSITGTLFSNLAVSALILYFPSFCAGVFNLTLTGNMSIIVPSRFPFTLVQRFNVLTSFSPLGLIQWGIAGSDVPNPLTDPRAWIYTLVLSAVFLALACAAFCLRKSEMAGRSAQNRTLNAIFRIAATMLVCVPICAIIFSDMINGSSIPFAVYVFLYTIALTVWIVWELITTKRWSRVAKTLPALGIVIALNVAIVLSFFAVRGAILSFRPEADDVKYARVKPDTQYGTVDMAEYALYLAKGDTVTDKDSLEILCRSLSETAEDEKRTGDYDYRDYSQYTVKEVEFVTATGAKSRNVRIKNSELTRIKYESAENVEELSVRIPDNVYFSDLPTGYGSESANDIIDSMRTELAGADPAEWFGFISGYSITYPESVLEISFSTENRMVSGLRVRVPLTTKFLPETTRLALEKIKEDDSVDWKEVKESLSENDDNTGYETVELFLYNEEKGWYESDYWYQLFYCEDVPSGDWFEDSKVEPGDSFAVFTVSQSDSPFVGQITVKITEEGLEKILEKKGING